MERVVIVMMDTRAAVAAHTRTPSHAQFTFELNRRYACKHGYHLLYLQMRGPTCQHPLLGERHPSYCKLAAVAEALSRGYDLVAFLDSDAFFQDSSMPLPQMLRAYAGNRSAGGVGVAGADSTISAASGVAAAPSTSGWDVSFAWDRPFSFGPNAGVQFWRNTRCARRLLRLWWHLPGGRFHAQHDYEQHLLQWNLLNLDSYASRISTLSLQSMATQLDVRGWPAYEHPIAHIDHGRSFFRLLLMSVALLRMVGQPPNLPMVRLDRRRDPDASLGGRGYDPSRVGSARDMQMALAGGEIGGMRGLEGYQTAMLRKRLIRQAARFLPRGGNRTFSRAWPGDGGRCSASSRANIEAFEPTVRARDLLGVDASGSLFDGRVSPRAGRSTTVAAVREQILHEALAGAPAQLVNCSVATRPNEGSHWWLTWRNASRGNASGLLELQTPQVTDLPGSSDPRYCLRIGPRRAPRQPDFALAQLRLCSSGAAEGTHAASLASFHYHRAESSAIPLGAIATRESVHASQGLPTGTHSTLTALRRVQAGKTESRTTAPAAAQRTAQLGRRLQSPATGGIGKMGGRGKGQGGKGKGKGKGSGAKGKGSGAKGGGGALFRGVGRGGKGRGARGLPRGAFWASLSEAEKERRRKRKQMRLRRRSKFVGQQCSSIYKTEGDKATEDCEDWCDESKIGHCRYCKCRGCNFCHGDLSLPDWIFGADPSVQCAAFGLCANGTITYPLCLSVWKGEIHEGAPLVWSRCRKDVYRHQQWLQVPQLGVGATERPVALQLAGFGADAGPSSRNAEPLCAAVPMPMSILK